MTTPKRIADIRFFESDIENKDGMLPDALGQLIKEPVSHLHSIGQRIALKLRELEFKFHGFDHVYINFSSAVQKGTIQMAQRSYNGPLKRIRYIDVGVDFATINGMTHGERNTYFVTQTFLVVHALTNEPLQHKIIQKVEYLYAELGESLPIVCKTKSTKRYQVEVSFEITPHPQPSSAWIHYTDKRQDQTWFGKFLDLPLYTYIFPLVGKIAVKGNQIILSPRKSATASILTEEFETPIIIDINSLDRQKSYI